MPLLYNYGPPAWTLYNSNPTGANTVRANIIAQECGRIKEKSNCTYISDLITCVHILQLKMLSCMRVGTKQKKVNVDMPVLDDFIHKV